MIDSFPYPILSRKQLVEQINHLGFLRTPFLFIINYKADQGYVIKIDELDERYVRFRFQSQKYKAKNQEPRAFQWQVHPISLKEYQSKFKYVQQEIHRGNSFLTNLTQPTEVQSNISLFDLYQLSSTKYKLWIKEQFIFLSPETFVQIHDGQISSFPMKGTIDASIPNAEEHILNDLKEKAEHATMVDLIRNDLSLVADHVEVKRYRYVEKITTNKQDLLQVSS